MTPLIVLEDEAIEAFDRVVTHLQEKGWSITYGWTLAGGVPPGALIACAGDVRNAADASEAVLAAVRGAAVVVRATADREVIDRLCEDLRHLGPLDHRTHPEAPAPEVSEEARAIAALLSDGISLGEAAERMHISRRTADRRLAELRRALGVRTTAEALLALRRRASP